MVSEEVKEEIVEKVKGILFILLAAVGFCLMSVFVRLAAVSYTHLTLPTN